MKTKIAVILSLFIYCTNVSFAAGTAVSGYISHNIHWTAAGSPYLVTGNIVVKKNATLYIDSGVVVKFNKSKSIEVTGTIRAIGSGTNPVKFTSNLSNPAPGDWGYIFLDDTCTNYDFKKDSGSIFQHCIVEDAGDSLTTFNSGIFTAVHAHGSAPFIDKCVFRNNKCGALDFDNTRSASMNPATVFIKITNCTFQNNNLSNHSFSPGGIGITNATKCNITVSGNTMTNNFGSQGGGLILTADNLSVATISGNKISNNTGSFGGGVYMYYGCKLWFTGNMICNNTAQEGAGVVIGPYGTSTYIYNNLFYGNSAIMAAGVELSYGGDSIFFHNNLVANNTASSDMGGMYIDNYNNKYASIYENQFIDNHSNGTTAINDSIAPAFIPLYVTYIHHNTIYRNERLNRNDSGFAVRTNYTNTFKNNNIHTSDSAGTFFELRNTSLQYSLNLDASDCYWGYTSQSAIRAHIFDSINDPFRSTVVFTPFLSSPDTIAPVTPPVAVIKTDIGGGKIKLSWQQNTEADIAGYAVYSGSSTGYLFSNASDAGKASSYTINAKLSDIIAVTAYDNQKDPSHGQYEGNESWYTYAVDTSIHTGITNTVSIAPDVKIYPNPFSSQAVLEIKGEAGNSDHYTMTVYDQLGKTINVQNDIHDGLNIINRNAMPAGLYFYSIINKNGTVLRGKFLVN